MSKISFVLKSILRLEFPLFQIWSALLGGSFSLFCGLPICAKMSKPQLLVVGHGGPFSWNVTLLYTQGSVLSPLVFSASLSHRAASTLQIDWVRERVGLALWACPAWGGDSVWAGQNMGAPSCCPGVGFPT